MTGKKAFNVLTEKLKEDPSQTMSYIRISSLHVLGKLTVHIFRTCLEIFLPGIREYIQFRTKNSTVH